MKTKINLIIHSKILSKTTKRLNQIKPKEKRPSQRKMPVETVQAEQIWACGSLQCTTGEAIGRLDPSSAEPLIRRGLSNPLPRQNITFQLGFMRWHIVPNCCRAPSQTVIMRGFIGHHSFLCSPGLPPLLSQFPPQTSLLNWDYD